MPRRGSGCAAWRSPNPTTLKVDAAGLLLVGLWNLGISVINLAAGNASQSLWIFLGIIQIIWAVQRFRQSSKFTQVQHVPGHLIQRVETLVKHIQRAKASTASDLIEFRANGKRWKGQLTSEMVVLVAGKAQKVRFALPDEFALTPQKETEPGKRVKASFRVQADTCRGNVPYESLRRYEEWKTKLTSFSSL